MYTTLVVALIALFVGVIVTAYCYEHRIRTSESAQKAIPTTGLDPVYKLGYDVGYFQGGQDTAKFNRIMSRSN